MRGPRAAALGAGLTAALLAALAGTSARAAIPGPEKIVRAVAETNRVSGRAEPLWIEVRLIVGDGRPAAEGVLAAHPSGLARLELETPMGFVERHLLQGSEYQASRDGEILPAPHPFLPPVFLLQASSGEALSAALDSFGIAEQEVVLGRLGPHDCYVLGGRLIGGGSDEALLPSLWVDAESHDAVRIVRSDGVEYRLGPIEVFDGVRLPRWIEIRTPADFRARLEILGAAPASAPAAAFQSDWLTQLPAPGPGAGATDPGSEGGPAQDAPPARAPARVQP